MERHEKPVTCLICGVVFQPKPHATTQKYCIECGVQHRKARERAYYIGTYVPSKRAPKLTAPKSPRELGGDGDKYNLRCDRCKYYQHCTGIVWSSQLLPCQPKDAEITIYAREMETI